MELWIRSQDKNSLKKVENIYIEKIEKDFDSWIGNTYSRPYVITCDCGNLGFYATKERALEVLDEIQEKFNSRIYIKSKALMTSRDLERAKITLEKLNNQELTIIDNSFELIPTSDDVVIYEMPQE